MKKLFLALVAICSMSCAIAQPHTWLVYGTANYDNNTTNANNVYNQSNTAITWSINPGIGYQFNQHLTVGIQGSYSYTSNSNPNYGIYPYYVSYPYYYYGSLPSSSYNWSVGAFGRYTHWFSNIFFMYGQINMGYLAGSETYKNGSYNSVKGTYEDAKYPSNGFQTALFPGIGANIYKGLAITFDFGGINYISQSQDDASGGHNTSSRFNINFAHQINIGISKNLAMHPRHHKHGKHEPGAEYRKHNEPKDDDDDDAPPAKKSK